MTIRMPPFLHDVFGESQTLFELLAIILFGAGSTTFLFLAYPQMTASLPFWKILIAFLLILDITAGSVANFTRSTSNYYAGKNNRSRVVFILIHVHILLLAWLLGFGWLGAIVVWGYTIAGALVVNALTGNTLQKFTAGLLLVLGIAIIVTGLEMPAYFLMVSLLFLVKVLYAFAVDHYPFRGDPGNNPTGK